MINLGTDIMTDWSFSDGDLNIVSDTGNLGQAISNRLNTYLNDLNLFYTDYGSTLFDYLGSLNNENIREYIRIEVESTVIKDNRIQGVDCTVKKVQSNAVECVLNLQLVDNTDVSLDLIITAENVVIL